MSAIHCHECGRPNSVTARRCIWCSVPISDDRAARRLDTTSVEIGYLEGLDRFDDAGPVRLIVSAQGIEVLELMPGSRSVNIPADCILETRVRHSLASHNGPSESKPWKRLLKVPSTSAAGDTAKTAKRRSDLTIEYRIGDEIREAVFYRDDPDARVVVEALVKVLSKLVRSKDGAATV